MMFLLVVIGVVLADPPLARLPLAGETKGVAVSLVDDPARGKVARFDGKTSSIRLDPIKLGTGDFTISVWAKADDDAGDAPGDLLSQYDPATRKGFSLSLKSAWVTSSQSNDRNLQFAIDSGTTPKFLDRGRPGNAVYIMSMAVHEGSLYAGTCEAGETEAGHVYRYDGAKWTDLGHPDKSNAVVSLASFDGRLYAGTGKYRLAGSSLQESKNLNLGGGIFRLDPDGTWADCGRLPGTESIGGMVHFRGHLYASSLYKPAGFFRYRGGRDWDAMPVPVGPKRVDALSVFNGKLYATSYDGCDVYWFDGKAWESLGTLESSGQTYSFEPYLGKLHVATWPKGRVFRLDGDKTWAEAGRLGEELEVMAMQVFNAKLYGGTLPLGEVHRLDGEKTWTRMAQLDTTPGVKYRRVWSMAAFQGQLLCGTLPSGHVYAMEAGQVATHDHRLPGGWHHIAARRQGTALSLFLDGKPVASSPTTPAAPLDLDGKAPLLIGDGPNDHFLGELSDLRFYGKALADPEIAAQAKARP